MLAYDYPLLGAFLTMMFFFLWITWIIIFFRSAMDIFRSDDLGGGAKALWLLLIMVLPYLGVLIYMVARGSGMAQRDIDRAQAQDDAVKEYIRNTAGGTGVAGELASLADLRDKGVLTDDEFQTRKAKLLA